MNNLFSYIVLPMMLSSSCIAQESAFISACIGYKETVKTMVDFTSKPLNIKIDINSPSLLLDNKRLNILNLMNDLPEGATEQGINSFRYTSKEGTLIYIQESLPELETRERFRDSLIESFNEMQEFQSLGKERLGLLQKIMLAKYTTLSGFILDSSQFTSDDLICKTETLINDAVIILHLFWRGLPLNTFGYFTINNPQHSLLIYGQYFKKTHIVWEAKYFIGSSFFSVMYYSEGQDDIYKGLKMFFTNEEMSLIINQIGTSALNTSKTTILNVK